MLTKDTILIADDVQMNRELLTFFLEEKYNILEASDGEQAINIIKEEKTNLAAILMDLEMPNKSGYDVLRDMRDANLIDEIPVLVITADCSAETEQVCFDLGVFDFIAKPFSRKIVETRMQNAITIFSQKHLLEQQVQKQTKALQKALLRQQEMSKLLKAENENIIDMLGTVVEYRSVESGEHVQRVKDYTRALGQHYLDIFPDTLLTEKELEVIVSASPLHDIGKIAISDAILLKPGRLTKEEFEIMKTHTTLGSELLSRLKELWISEDASYERTVNEICRYHHERYDGRGYPDGLVGDEIPISAQLVSLADVYDALVNDRCYKAAFTPEQAFNMITNGECGVFSPRIMESFIAARSEFEAIKSKNIKAQIFNEQKSHKLKMQANVQSEVMHKLRLGTWSIEIHEGEPNQLYMDAVMEDVMAMSPDLDPYEAFEAWSASVLPEEQERTAKYLDDIINKGKAEIVYRWLHPRKGMRLVRCAGIRDVSAVGYIRIMGMHRDLGAFNFEGGK